MLKMRRVFITGDINDDSAKAIVQQLLYLEADDPHAPVTIFINSGGGLVHSGLALLDVIFGVSMPIHTVAYGRCFSIAAILLSCGAPGRRAAYEHTRLMIHEPSCSYPKLQATDIIIKADELRHTQQTLESILSARTGRSQAEIAKSVLRDHYMSAQEAKGFGLVDMVLPPGEASMVLTAMGPLAPFATGPAAAPAAGATRAATAQDHPSPAAGVKAPCASLGEGDDSGAVDFAVTDIYGANETRDN